MSSAPTAETLAEKRDRTVAWSLLSLTALAFVAFLTQILPSLSNTHFGDIEFTGWSGPVGTNLLSGLRPYIDFVLPIPPGSLALLALIQKVQGKSLVLQELVVNEGVHVLMGLLAYVIARPFASRKAATWTAICTLIIVWEINKECAYDSTAQLFAWGSVAAGAHALSAANEARSRRLLALVGFLAAFTLAFKQSTALGAVFGWYAALLYLAAVALVSREAEAARAIRRSVVALSTGVGFGLLSVWLLLLSLGSTARAFFEASFVDASRLKGGPRLLVENLFSYVFIHGSYSSSLGAVALCVLIGFRATAKRGHLHAGDAMRERGHFSAWEVVAAGLLVVGFTAAGIWFLRKGPVGYPITWVVPLDAFREVARLSLAATAGLFAAHLVRTGTDEEGLSAEARHGGHALNALVIAGLASTLMHNTSAPEFRPFYDNNVIIPIALAAMFLVLERAKLPWVALLVILLTFVGAAGNKYYRAMTAKLAIPSGHWAGMRLNAHELVIYQAAERARALAGPHGSVLVLPEDVQMAALIDRPRPPLRGAIVFVDQYAARLADEDIQRLDENLPTVIVMHPRERLDWQRFFRIWSGASGAERIIDHVVGLLPIEYRLDSSYPTTFLWSPAVLDVYVRRSDR